MRKRVISTPIPPEAPVSNTVFHIANLFLQINVDFKYNISYNL